MYAEIQTYLHDVQHSISRVNVANMESIIDTLFDAFLHGRTVYTMGNGASAALASHIACDLGKGTATDIGRGSQEPAMPRLRIVSLVDNVALTTAYGNDVHYQDIFLEQLKGLLRRGDVVLGISGSGSSPNVIRALEYARKAGATTLGMTGSRPSATMMCDLCDTCLQAPLMMMEQIEDLHVVFSHAIATALRGKVAAHVASLQDLQEPGRQSVPIATLTVTNGSNGRSAEADVPAED